MKISFESNRHRRTLFDSDVSAYAHGRPEHPERVYDLLGDVCGLGSGTRVVEIGAFEDVDLPDASADMVVAATSFHWVPTDAGLRRCAELLRLGGWLALWWSYFGDPHRPDPFHDALLPLLAEHAPSVLDVPSAGATDPETPYALDAEVGVAEIDATSCFGPVLHELIAWTGRHTSAEIRSMFASFSPWLALPLDERTAALDALENLAIEEFGGIVERPYLTSIYLAQRLGQM